MMDKRKKGKNTTQVVDKLVERGVIVESNVHVKSRFGLQLSCELYTSLICPFSVLACPTVIFLKKRSFVSNTEKHRPDL